MSNLSSQAGSRTGGLLSSLGLAAWLLSMVLVLPASAVESSRTLNGHDFLPSEVVDAPFAVGYLSTLTGGGQAFDVKTPFVNTDGEALGTLEGDVAFMALGFRYQHRFGDWFAARVGFGGGARVGTDEQAILAQGVTGTYGLNLGATARILQRDTFILSGGLDFNRTEAVGLDPYGFAQRVIDNGGLDPENNELVASGKVYTTRLSVMAGWAPYDWLGIHGYLDGGRATVPDAESQTLLGGAIAAGIDLQNLDLFPLGVQLVVRDNAFMSAGADLASRAWSWGFGLYYTGWEEFSVGFETTMNQLNRRDEGEDFESMVATFNLRYWPGVKRAP